MLDAGSAPALLIAGGIGITPIKAMAHAPLRDGRPFSLHYSVRARSQAAFLPQLQEHFGQQLVVYPSDEAKRIDIDMLMRTTPSETIVYVCGPTSLIDAVSAGAARAGRAEDSVRYERFVSASARIDDQPLTVTLARSGPPITPSSTRSGPQVSQPRLRAGPAFAARSRQGARRNPCSPRQGTRRDAALNRAADVHLRLARVQCRTDAGSLTPARGQRTPQVCMCLPQSASEPAMAHLPPMWPGHASNLPRP